MSLADRTSPSPPEDLRCGHPPIEVPQPRLSRWSAALERLRTRYPKPNHGDEYDGRPPYAVIHVQLFKPDTDQGDKASGGSDFDQETYARIEEQIERVIRVNRNTHFRSLMYFSEVALFPLACGLAGWSAGFLAALQLVLFFEAPK
ncbi:MAG: hypothetical protein JSR83_22430 [Proteobacteria bacterium]|nr:hypothetical protein [Pseudomonadota bacterium]